MKTNKRVAIPFILSLSIYVLSYAILSSFGAYAPRAWGLSQQGMRPKWYAWAPPGFYNPATGEWMDTPMQMIYSPLLAADNCFWHTHYYPKDRDPQHPVVFPAFKR